MEDIGDFNKIADKEENFRQQTLRITKKTIREFCKSHNNCLVG
jgi:hypothetical protein